MDSPTFNFIDSLINPYNIINIKKQLSKSIQRTNGITDPTSIDNLNMIIDKYFYQLSEQVKKERDEEWKMKVDKLKVVRIDGNWDMKPCKNGEEVVYCLTCGAFLGESICACEVENKTLDDLINSMK